MIYGVLVFKVPDDPARLPVLLVGADGGKLFIKFISHGLRSREHFRAEGDRLVGRLRSTLARKIAY